jgi:hypothetical protein
MAFVAWIDPQHVNLKELPTYINQLVVLKHLDLGESMIGFHFSSCILASNGFKYL